MEEWLSRTELCLGKERLEKIKSSNILVVGLGGVGAIAAEMLCRSGIGRMTIADGDIILPSNRNRQIHALISTERQPKALVMEKRLRDINPELQLTVINEFIRDERMIEILEEPFDYVVDAIDTLSPKVFLIYHSLRRNYRIISSMGSGGKFDPLLIKVSDISETSFCHLARMIRKKLHKLGIREGFKAVWSPEIVEKSRIIRTEGERNKASVAGTVPWMPAAFGIVIASVVIRDLAGIEINASDIQ
ncbi:MAG TPA: tRNA threonylcarbamoyladenosine dehydratase [Bacteroidales bacterium]|nr:tRNA threonylcarbamoyladenosine dehydratase [Bacteroidales bacterium]HOK74027.1 tRNA threonylcarbamoyladenosine dehydratase [Bacteroidales bacterium]HOM40819.1 tRNA threonylcarbamoyladenosine dehydratase [Bacteroidales bacterium]HOU29730.1 tRNA threonylcarbamoyladenosine dehydratase [Bacteroidales bacterium]HPP92517.1 tRNA threonylcarbamoyladenosine dehydratase [Bacteroidales bacterium]